MLRDVLPLLACPHCGSGLGALPGPAPEAVPRVLGCANGHRFDVARQGYVSLLAASRRGSADTAEMVAARERVQRGGHLEPVAVALRDAVRALPTPRTVLDLGAGTGYYLAAVLDDMPALDDMPMPDGMHASVGVALDLSTAAARRSAQAHVRTGSVVADTWQRWPLLDGVIDLCLTVFAPRNGAEAARVLAPGGHLVVVVPGARHLTELVDALELLQVDPDKSDRLQNALTPHLRLVTSTETEFRMQVDRATAADLVAMGPSSWHRDETALGRALKAMPQRLELTAAVQVHTFVR